MQPDTDLPETGPRERWQWQWRSNLDPWNKKETPEWTSYSPHDNYLIEKAYDEQKKKVEIGDYIVSIKEMVQRKKDVILKQRAIRRRKGSIIEGDRSERYFVTEQPKTINNIFGSLEDFTTFFSRRNSEIRDFISQFKVLEESNDLDVLKQTILPKVVSCLEEALLKPLEEKLKNPSLKLLGKRMVLAAQEPIKQLISIFRDDVRSLKEFYGRVLRAYTMNTSLFRNLNTALRNENWPEVDKFLPYTLCFYKPFSHPGFVQNKPRPSSSTTFYRGTSFDESALSRYDLKELQYFSWYSATSTTTNRTIAEGFMYESVDIKNRLYPVMFIIEIPSSQGKTESNSLKWLDVSPFSAMPKEEEVILAPGCVFELVNVSTDQNKRTIINIRLREDLKDLAHRGVMMQGALQSQMATEKEVKIMGLEREELNQALMSLRDNKLIEEVEFCLCEFSNKLINILFKILSTMEKIKKLKLISCKYQTKEDIKILASKREEKCELIKIEISDVNELFQILCSSKRTEAYWVSLRELELDFRGRKSLNNEEFTDTVSQKLKYLPQLTSLNINLGRCNQITDDGVCNFAQELASLVQLSSLILNFGECDKLTNKAVEVLVSEGLRNLTKLTTLTLDFRFCLKITEEGFIYLASKGLSSFQQLSSLNLDFGVCALITNKGLEILASEGLRNLSKLASLTLTFFASRITDEGVEMLISQGLKHLGALVYLNLDFSFSRMTDRGLKSLAAFLTSGLQLTDLTLADNGSYFPEITDEGINYKAIKNLTQLKSLALTFGAYPKISNVALSCIARLLKSIDRLAYLAFDFSGCWQQTDRGVLILISQGLADLKQLRYFSFEPRLNWNITEEKIHIFSHRWLKHPNILKSLIVNEMKFQTRKNSSSRLRLARKDLNPLELRNLQMILDDSQFCKESEIDLSQDVFDIIVELSSQRKEKMNSKNPSFSFSKILDKLQHGTSLTIDSEDYRRSITNKPLIILTSQVLKHLTKLESLNLNFSGCDRITDKELKKIFLHSNLTSLTLDLSWCFEITHKGAVRLFCNSLDRLSQLKYLNLSFEGIEITDDGIKSLAKDALGPLSLLTTLNLNFCGNDNITDNGILSLARDGLNSLSQLESLNLNLSLCSNITEKGIQSLVSKGLKNLIALKSLALIFSSSSLTHLRLSHIVSEALKNLTNLSSLALGFSESKINDEGMKNLAQCVLNHLSQLTSLNLNFSGIGTITDKGVNDLMSKGLKNLTQLTSLTLNFSFCPQISDQAMNNLVLQIVKNLSQLIFLDLNLEERMDRMDFTVNTGNIAKILHYFGFTKEIEDI